jgi:hypothetical protein
MRPNHPWYWAAKNAWFVEVGGQRHPLGKHPEGLPVPRKRKRGDPPPLPPDAIMQAYYRLMATASRKLPEAVTLHVCQVWLSASNRDPHRRAKRAHLGSGVYRAGQVSVTDPAGLPLRLADLVITVPLPGETESGSAGTQPDKG